MADRVATYRWQLTPADDLDAAAAAVADLAEIGVSHLYLSPITEAVPGSAHGYDATDPTRVRAELGGRDALDRLAAACRQQGLALLVDIVPNHLAVHHRNPWWWDVLKRGEASPYAVAFDINWSPPKQPLAGTVLLPVLGDHIGRELDAGNLRIEATTSDDDPFVVRYFDHVFPVSDESTAELADADIDAVNADSERLGDLLDRQAYRLARWTVADEEVDYRRFFDVDALIATQVERTDVFAAMHALPLELVAAGVVDGLRIDHVDGLRDPGAYLQRLRAATGARPWLLVEKILRRDELLPPSWPVEGTTGYEVADLLGGWLTDPAGAPTLLEGWRARVGETRSFEEVALEARREVLARSLVADVERIVDRLVEVCEGRRRHRDHTRRALHAAVVEVAVHAPAYRSYVASPGGGAVPRTSADDAFVAAAIGGAAEGGRIDTELLDLLRDVLLGRLTGPAETEVALRFQQLTGPVAAKGEEDRALYRWLPLPHRCEVGADPGRPVVDAAEWHLAAAVAQERWPARLTTLSTHDTKRSADARARLAALTTIPDHLLAAFDHWCELAGKGVGAEVDLRSAWMVFHILVAAHPIPVERAGPVVEKAAREAGMRTSWTRPDEGYEEALQRLVGAAVASPACQEVVGGLLDRLGTAGEVAALAQLGAQLLAPGVPDLYQGAERWDRSLVDPDNRRPVDPAHRHDLLARVAGTDAATAWTDADLRATGLPRLHLIRAALDVRRRHPGAFGAGPDGRYQALEVGGPDTARVLAFARGEEVALVTARPGAGAAPSADAEVELPPGRWRDVLVGEHHRGTVGAGDLVVAFPVAVLERADP